MSKKKIKFQVTEDFMNQLANETGLDFDTGNDNLYAETIFTNSKDLSREEYAEMEKDLHNYSQEGDGFNIYAWNDESGYSYWTIKQEEDNYIQITVAITGPANAAEIKKAVSRALSHFAGYSRY